MKAKAALITWFVVMGVGIYAGVKPSPAQPPGAGFFLSWPLVVQIIGWIGSSALIPVCLLALREFGRMKSSLNGVLEREQAQGKTLNAVIRSAIHNELESLHQADTDLNRRLSLLEGRFEEMRK